MPQDAGQTLHLTDEGVVVIWQFSHAGTLLHTHAHSPTRKEVIEHYKNFIAAEVLAVLPRANLASIVFPSQRE